MKNSKKNRQSAVAQSEPVVSTANEAVEAPVAEAPAAAPAPQVVKVWDGLVGKVGRLTVQGQVVLYDNGTIASSITTTSKKGNTWTGTAYGPATNKDGQTIA